VSFHSHLPWSPSTSFEDRKYPALCDFVRTVSSGLCRVAAWRPVWGQNSLHSAHGTRLRAFSYLDTMREIYSWPWVEAQTARSSELWNGCALRTLPALPRFPTHEQCKHEKGYDNGLRAVKREARRAPRTRAARLRMQERIVGLFPGFAATALGLEGDATHLLTNSFLPIGTRLAQWARAFDPTLSMADTIQGCRNAWTCGGMQALLGQPMELTPSILAYSLLYPYSDNFLDQPGLCSEDKLQFSERFRLRLCGQLLSAQNPREAAIWALVQLIEEQYSRDRYPQVFESLLAIHQAQQDSIAQLKQSGDLRQPLDASEVLRITCAKGGTSVLADACLAQPWLTQEEASFSFDWGVLLQIGDDLQDVQEDMDHGSVTLFTLAAANGLALDDLVMQLLHFSHMVADRMDRLPHGTSCLKHLLRMSWRSLILMAVANAHQFFSPAFLAQLETCSCFRFNFLRARNQKLEDRESLFPVIFEAFLEAGESHPSRPPQSREPLPADDLHSLGELAAWSNSFV